MTDPQAGPFRNWKLATVQRRRRQCALRTTGAGKVAAIDNYMLLLDSHERIAALLPLIEHEPAAIFWLGSPSGTLSSSSERYVS